MTFARSVADVRDVVAALGEPVHALLGHSWGGAVVVGAGREVDVARVVAIEPMLNAAAGVWSEQRRAAVHRAARAAARRARSADPESRTRRCRRSRSRPSCTPGATSRWRRSSRWARRTGSTPGAGTSARCSTTTRARSGSRSRAPKRSVFSTADREYAREHGGPNLRLDRVRGREPLAAARRVRPLQPGSGGVSCVAAWSAKRTRSGGGSFASAVSRHGKLVGEGSSATIRCAIVGAASSRARLAVVNDTQQSPQRTQRRPSTAGRCRRPARTVHRSCKTSRRGGDAREVDQRPIAAPARGTRWRVRAARPPWPLTRPSRRPRRSRPSRTITSSTLAGAASPAAGSRSAAAHREASAAEAAMTAIQAAERMCTSVAPDISLRRA